MPRQKKPIDLKQINEAVQHFVDHRGLFDDFARALLRYFHDDPQLAKCIHFSKYRLKDPDHLKKKLVRKAQDGRLINKGNLFEKITDLAGVRLIHLHTSQVPEIHAAILAIIKNQKLNLVKDPVANCWDIEYETMFQEFGIATRSRDSMYTTLHYVIRMNERTKVSCELQVRTLMDEVWGEVSHRIDYPVESKILACRNQLKVLARLTTGCTRLVDSIFASNVPTVTAATKKQRSSTK